MFPFDAFIDDWNDGDFADNNLVTPLTGTSGNDLILADAGDNKMEGLEGNDLLVGGPGSTTIFVGGEGNDILNGLSSNFNILEESGDFSFVLSDTNLFAFDGSGTFYMDWLFGMDQAELHATGNNDHTINAFTFTGNFTSLQVDGGNNTIIGSNQFDQVIGGAGQDTITGNGGDDIIFGNNGNDNITGDGGDDDIFAGNGADTISGGSGSDDLYGDNGNDSLTGDGGADTIGGGAGADTISGGAGSDDLYGDNGNDSITGNGGDDLIVGGAGADILTSGSALDSDIFGYGSISEGGDTIIDFDTVGVLVDMIQVEASGFAATGGANPLSAGVLPSGLLVLGAANLGNNAGFRYIETTGALYFDSNGGMGTGGTTLLATLTNTPTIADLDGHIVVV